MGRDVPGRERSTCVRRYFKGKQTLYCWCIKGAAGNKGDEDGSLGSRGRGGDFYVTGVCSPFALIR